MNKKFVIASKKITHHKHEIERLISEAKAFYQEAFVIDPIHCSYIFDLESSKLSVLHENLPLDDVSTIHIRNTSSRQNSISLFCNVFNFKGSNLSDPIQRFNLTKASKILSTFNRFSYGVGGSSFISFHRKYSSIVLEKWNFPILYKPVAGKQGKGIKLIKDLADFNKMLDSHFKKNFYDNNPILLQKYYSYQREFRVVVYDKKVICASEKIQPNSTIVQKNHAQGAYFIKANGRHFTNFVEKANLDDGLYGLDIGELNDNKFHLIESNRSPKFGAFEEATGINLAKYITSIESKKLSVRLNQFL